MTRDNDRAARIAAWRKLVRKVSRNTDPRSQVTRVLDID